MAIATKNTPKSLTKSRIQRGTGQNELGAGKAWSPDISQIGMAKGKKYLVWGLLTSRCILCIGVFLYWGHSLQRQDIVIFFPSFFCTRSGSLQSFIYKSPFANFISYFVLSLKLHFVLHRIWLGSGFDLFCPDTRPFAHDCSKFVWVGIKPPPTYIDRAPAAACHDRVFDTWSPDRWCGGADSRVLELSATKPGLTEWWQGSSLQKCA